MTLAVGSTRIRLLHVLSQSGALVAESVEDALHSLATSIANSNCGIPAVRCFMSEHESGSPQFVAEAAPPLLDPSLEPVSLAIPLGVTGRRAVVQLFVGDDIRADAENVVFFELLRSSIAGILAQVAWNALERGRASARAELDQAKIAFFSNVSHEFRTPLTLLLGLIEEELAEDEQPLPPGRHARLETARRNGIRLLRMVNTLLDFWHIEAGRMDAAFEPVDLAAVTEDVATGFRAAIEKVGLRLSTRLETLPEPVYVDRDMWTKVVLNLLSNALKHTFKGGITVSLFASDESKDFIELRVDDTGIGIPPRELPKLFQRFHRVQGARSRSDEGTGVGLALIRAIARLHGGDVSAVSREGLGSSFRVRLRRGAAHLPKDKLLQSARAGTLDATHVAGYVEEAMQWSASESERPEPHALDIEEASKAEPGVRRARVLLADRNRDMRSYIGRLLGRSYDVTAVADGDAALQSALDQPPDIIVLDAVLPVRNGFELLKELRASERTRSIPVILLSSRAGEDAALEGLDAGADDYLVKPFTGKALVARVRSCLTLAKVRREAAEKLAEANKELEAFSYSVSHDLRAPLRAIDGFSKVLLTEYGQVLDERGRRYLDRVRSGTQRMAELIDDLLSLSKITRAPMKRETVDVTSISRKILVDLSARDADRTVETKVADGLTAEGDARLVTVALENLLGNAWKFTSKQPAARIEVASEERDGEPYFLVRDNGAGFDMKYVNKLFAPFQRLHSASEFQGTGIGLATVHRVVVRHGGRIWADASPGSGAAFYFSFAGRS